MEASNLFSLFQIPYRIWIEIATIFAYKMSTPTPILEQMYMYDIILQYKELGEIIKKENGEGDGSESYEKKMEEYKNDMSSKMDSFKSGFSSNMPNINGLSNMPNISNINVPSLSSGFKMPKI